MAPGTDSSPGGGAAKAKVVEGADAIARVIESAARLGVELDEREPTNGSPRWRPSRAAAISWLT